jgi:hypothetical protein
VLIPVTMFRITGTNSTRNRIGVFLALASAGPRYRHAVFPTPWPDLDDQPGEEGETMGRLTKFE